MEVYETHSKRAASTTQIVRTSVLLHRKFTARVAPGTRKRWGKEKDLGCQNPATRPIPNICTGVFNALVVHIEVFRRDILGDLVCDEESLEWSVWLQLCSPAACTAATSTITRHWCPHTQTSEGKMHSLRVAIHDWHVSCAS